MTDITDELEDVNIGELTDGAIKNLSDLSDDFSTD